jgi:hypothetical protein
VPLLYVRGLVFYQEMRLLETTNGRSYRLTEYFLRQSQIPAYANQEVTFDDINKYMKSKYRKPRSTLRIRPRSEKRSHKKLMFCAQRAKRDGLRYIWVDARCSGTRTQPSATSTCRARRKNPGHLHGKKPSRGATDSLEDGPFRSCSALHW